MLMNFNEITANSLNVWGDIWVNIAKYDVNCLKTFFGFSFPSQKNQMRYLQKQEREKNSLGMCFLKHLGLVLITIYQLI